MRLPQARNGPRRPRSATRRLRRLRPIVQPTGKCQFWHPGRTSAEPALHHWRVASAQQIYSLMMKERVAPALRALGFKGSERAFTLPADGFIAQLGFQKSNHSDQLEVLVTANISAVSLAAWDEARERWPHLPTRPSPNTAYGPFFWQQRVPNLLPSRSPAWWRVSAHDEPGVVGDDIVGAVRDYALPALRLRIGASGG